MSRAQVLAALFLTHSICVAFTEEITAQPKIDEFLRPPPFGAKLTSQTPQEPSYFSRFTSWLFPFGADSTPQPVVHQQPVRQQYLPPGAKPKENCNSCNKEPWIPVVSKFGTNTLIGFVPPSNVVNQGNAPLVYGPPLNNLPPPTQYKPPTNIQYGPPRPSPPLSGYRPSNNLPPSKEYGPPINVQHGPPVKPASLPNGASVQAQLSQFVVPPAPLGTYGPPKSNYGPPISSPKLPIPPTRHPAPAGKYRPSYPTHIGPIPTSSQSISSSLIAPPYLPPLKYGHPPSKPVGDLKITNFHPPTAHLNEFISPPPISTLPSGTLRNIPSSHSNNKPTLPPSNYGLPPIQNQPLHPANGATFVPRPAEEITLTFNLPPLYNNQLPSGKLNGKLVDSYGPPPAGPISNSDIKVTSEEYIPPKAQLPLASGPGASRGPFYLPPSPQQPLNHQILEPIPFPNMSPSFVLPIHKAQPFRSSKHIAQATLFNHIHIKEPKGSSSQNSQITNQGNQGSDIQVIKSVPIASFVSTIEYPPRVIQSPIIDLNIQENNQKPDQNIQDFKINLSENPIIVHEEEHHQEASDTHTAISLQNDTEIVTSNYQNNELSEPLNHSSDIQTIVKIEPSLQTVLEDDDHFSSLLANHLLSENTDYPPKPFEVYKPDIEENIEQKIKKDVNENAQATNDALFTPPSLDYSSWFPSSGQPLTSMVPPPLSQNTWVSTNNFSPFTTKRPKQIQIIVPYTSNNNIQHSNNWFNSTGQASTGTGFSTDIPNTPLSIFTKLPTMEESQWTKYIDHNLQESQKISDTAESLPSISNLKDFFHNSNMNVEGAQQLPFDIIKLQKNIDVWTEQEYNKMKSQHTNKSSTSSKFTNSKIIPNEFFTTPSLLDNEVTSEVPNLETKHYHDYLASGTFQHLVESEARNITELLNFGNSLLETNLIGSDLTTTQQPEALDGSPLNNLTAAEVQEKRNTSAAKWDKIQVSISPLTNEKVYVVTPQPWGHDSTTPASAWMYVPKKEIEEINKQLAQNAHYVFSSPRFSIRPEPGHFDKSKEVDTNQKIHLVYSDWPDLINNLATTTEKQSATHHPLLGRMDISSLTPSSGSVRTYTGHSRVASAVTASSIFSKKTERVDKTLTSFADSTDSV